MNLRGLIYKLQKALLQKGVVVKVNQRQQYFEGTKRMVTKYIVKIGKDTILETFHAEDVVKELARIYGDAM